MIADTLASIPASFFQPQSGRAASRPLESMVRDALDQPINFPRLMDSIFTGDRVAIALQPDVPQAREVARAVVRYLLDHGVEPNDIALVVPKRMNYGTDVDGGWEALAKIDVRVHDPDQDADVSHLGATGEGQAIKINETLFDADVILPIACVDSADYSRLYPEFSSAKTIQRLRPGAPISESNRLAELRLTHEHLGLFSAFNVVAKPGGGVAGCFFGDRNDCDVRAAELAAQVWQVAKQTPSDLIVVTLESTDAGRDWQDFCLALAAAEQICDNPAQILALTEIDHLPRCGLRDAMQLAFESDDEALYRKLKKRDAATRRAVQVLRDRHVFLKSQLRQHQVEELGLGFVESDADARRLLNRARSGIVLRDAHRIQVLIPSKRGNDDVC